MKICIISLRPGLQKGENPNVKILTEDLGVSCLAAVIEGLNHDLAIIDQAMSDLRDEEVCRSIIDFRPDVIAFTESNNTVMRLLEVARRCREALRDAVILLGDIIPSQYADDFLEPSMPFDAVCIGEGDMTFLETVKRIEKRQPLDGIPGLLTKTSGRRTFVSRRKIADLSSLPKARRYFLSALTPEEREGLDAMILGSRGCIGSCSFCGNRALESLTRGKTWRGRKAVEIVDEMEEIIRRFGINSFTFVDSLWVGPPTDANRKRILTFCNEILKRGLKVSFMISSRIDFFRIPEDAYLLQALVEAGIRAMFIGIESGCQATLKLYNKGRVTPEGIIETIDFLRAEGVLPRIGFISFHPFALKDELRGNIDFLRRIRSDHLVRSFANRLNLFRHYPIFELIDHAGLVRKGVPRWLPQSYRMASQEVGRISDLVGEIYPLFVQTDSAVDRLETRLWGAGATGRMEAERLQSEVSAIYQDLFMRFLDLDVNTAKAMELRQKVIAVHERMERPLAKTDGAEH